MSFGYLDISTSFNFLKISIYMLNEIYMKHVAHMLNNTVMKNFLKI